MSPMHISEKHRIKGLRKLNSLIISLDASDAENNNLLTYLVITNNICKKNYSLYTVLTMADQKPQKS